MANLHPFAMLNQKKPNPGIPHVSLIQRDLVLLVNVTTMLKLLIKGRSRTGCIHHWINPTTRPQE